MLYTPKQIIYHSRPSGSPPGTKPKNQEKYLMKKIAFTLIAGLGVAGSVLAGPATAGKTDKTVTVPVEPCFRDHELQLDVFANYMHFTHAGTPPSRNGEGGGLGVNYFFTRYLGVGIDGSANSLSHGLFNATGSLIARYPLELGSVCLAPYAFGGGGVQTNGSTLGTGHAGAGVEFRVTPKLGIYGEGRYTWTTEHNEDSSQARLGLRFAF